MNVLCKPCAEEYFGFLSLKLPGLGNHPTAEQTAILVASFKACDFPALLAELDRQQLPLTELRTHSATLEDVFVTLTGRHLRDE